MKPTDLTDLKANAAAMAARLKLMSHPERLVMLCREMHPAGVEIGRFGAHMVVSLVNDGPVTFLLRP